jgi:hypothetical protein
MLNRDELRLESVLQAATCGRENARESEEHFGGNIDDSAGSSVPDGGRSRCARAYLQAQPSLPDFWPAKGTHLPVRRALLVTSEADELGGPRKERLC